MVENFLTVFLQVVILFCLIAFGFIGGKIKLINEEGSKVMSNIMIYFVTPCLIINSFSIEFDPKKLKGLLITFVSSFAIHLIAIILASLIFRGNNKNKISVLRFAAIFSNAGFMGIPLQEAVLGPDGVFYGSVYVAVFNIIIWTYGVYCMTSDIKEISLKRLLFNPGIIGVTIGLIFFFLPISLTPTIQTVISSMANLNTPLAMIIIGFYLCKSNFANVLRDKSLYLVISLRLIAIPLISLAILLLFGVREIVLVSLIVSASAPVAAVTSIFSTKFSRDTEFSVNLVTITTVLSILTMPLVVALSQYFA